MKDYKVVFRFKGVEEIFNQPMCRDANQAVSRARHRSSIISHVMEVEVSA